MGDLSRTNSESAVVKPEVLAHVQGKHREVPDSECAACRTKRVHARINLMLDIPADVAQEALLHSAWERTPIGTEPDHDRESVGDRLDEWVADHFAELLNYIVSDPEAECDW